MSREHGPFRFLPGVPATTQPCGRCGAPSVTNALRRHPLCIPCNAEVARWS